MDFARYWRLLWGFFLVDWKPNRETGLFTLLTVAVVLAPQGHQSSCGQFQCNTDTLCRVFPIIVIAKLCHRHRHCQTCWQKKPWCQSYYCILWPWRANKSVIVDKVTWTLAPTRNIHNGSWTIIFQWEVLGALCLAPTSRSPSGLDFGLASLPQIHRYRYGSVSLMHSLCKPRTS